MSVIFGGKLLAPKSKNISQGVEIEKNIQTLSKREQELLDELQSTRANIVRELVRISPNIKPDNLGQWKDTMSQYESKLKSSTTMDSTTIGTPAGGRGAFGGSGVYSRPSTTTTRAKTSHKQSKQPPRTLQSLPIMTLTGEFAFSAKFARDDPLVLPIMTLPSVTMNSKKFESQSHLQSQSHSQLPQSHTQSQSAPQMMETKASQQFILSNIDQFSLQYILNFYSVKFDEWKEISSNFETLKDMSSHQNLEQHNLQTVFNSFKPFEGRRKRDSQTIFDSDFQSTTGLNQQQLQQQHGNTLQSSSKLPPIKKLNTTHSTSLFHEPSFNPMKSTATTMTTATAATSIELESSKKLHTSRSFSFKPAATGTETSKYPSKTRERIRSRPNVYHNNYVNGMNSNNNFEKSSTESLRQELYKSLDTMQRHTSEVKQSIINVQELVALNNPRARAFITTMAADQLCVILTKVGRRELKRGWDSWCLSLKLDLLMDKTKKIQHFLLLRQVATHLNKLVLGVLRYNFLEWVKYCVEERLRLEMELKTAAAITIQRVVRGNIGREKARKIVDGNKFAKLHRSLIKLQALFRGKLQRWKYLKYRRDILEETSCELIQKVVRGFLGRRRANRIRSYASKVSAAITIQAAARGRKGRIIASALRLLRLKNKVIVKIQALARGYIGRRRVATILKEKVQTAAAIKIQARMRGALTRMNLHHRKRELEEYRSERNRYATKIQAVYRGFRARVMFRYYMEEHNQEVALKNKSATIIQCMIRKFLARHKVARLEQDRLDRWIADASTWKEIWSEDSGAWFYLNETTQEALWEPPSIGYTKVDGQLVLRNGKIIDPPDLTGKKKRKAGQEHLCVECVKRVAIRKCNECGDNFCTKCYKETHSSGSRKQHTYEAIGPLDCTECEEELAERWCISCDEPYCDSCWRKVHSKGKRRYHPFSQVQEDGHIDPRIFTIDGEQVHNYDASYSQNRYEEESAAAAGTATGGMQSNALEYGSEWDNDASQSQYYEYDENNYNGGGANTDANYYNDDSSNWMEYYDENNVVYWYNSSTGESSYENPMSNY